MVYMQIIYLWIAGILNLCLIETMNELGLQVISKNGKQMIGYGILGEPITNGNKIEKLKTIKMGQAGSVINGI